MSAPVDAIRSRAHPRRSLLALVLILALANAWSLQYSGAMLFGDADLPPFASLFTVHVLLSIAFIAVLSLRCELFIPTPGELGFFCLAGFLGNVLSLGVELFAAAHAPAGLVTSTLSVAPVLAIAVARIIRTGSASRPLMRLNPLQVATGVAIAATVMLAPMAQREGELFLLEGPFGPPDLALSVFALALGAEYYLLTLLFRLAASLGTASARVISRTATIRSSALA
jgi:hypothetical protein